MWAQFAEACGWSICRYHKEQIRAIGSAKKLTNGEFRAELRKMREEMERCKTGCVMP